MQKVIKLSIIGLAIIIFIAFFHYLSWLDPVESFVFNIISPFQEKTMSVASGLRGFYGNWITNRDFLAENKELREQLAKSKLDLARINSLEEENDILRSELNFVEDSGLNFVSAKIITGVSDQLSQSVVINRGSRDGITKGLAVVAEDGVMIGKVYEVSDSFSKVLLLTDNNSKVAATIQNQEKTAGLVEGQFGLSLSMTNIPQDALIMPGDLIVTSGLEGKIPQNILIAEVDKVNQVESEIFQTAVLNPIVSFERLSSVLVIIP